MALTYFSVITIQPSKSVLGSVKPRFQFRNYFAFWQKENPDVTLATAIFITTVAHSTALLGFQILPTLLVTTAITNIRKSKFIVPGRLRSREAVRACAPPCGPPAKALKPKARNSNHRHDGMCTLTPPQPLTPETSGQRQGRNRQEMGEEENGGSALTSFFN